MRGRAQLDHGQRSGSNVVDIPGIKLYRKQHAALFDPRRIVCIESTTKAGKTVGALAWQFKKLMESPEGDDWDHWWVAPSYAQAKMAYRLAWKHFFRSSPATPNRPARIKLDAAGATQNKSELTITAPNGARWTFKTAENPDLLYGEAVYSVVIDEASRCKDAAITACRSTTTVTRGQMRLIGNVRGRHNLHYQWSRKGEAGEPGFGYHRITADDAVAAGVFRRSDVNAARRAMPHAVFRELYYCEPSDDGANPFGLKHIAACVDRCGGKLAPGPVRVWGFDYARNTDWCVLVGLNQKREVCAFERWHGEPAYSRERLVSFVKPSRAPLMLDSTGMGDHLVDDVHQRGIVVEGYHLTGPSKQHLVEGLTLAIQSHATTVLDGPHKAEMESFEYSLSKSRNVMFSAPPGAHDDCVIAHALAWYGAERWGVREHRGAALPILAPRATTSRVF